MKGLHHTRLSFCSSFISACPPEPSQKSQRAAGSGREERRGIFGPYLLTAQIVSPGCDEGCSLLPAIFPLPPPSFPSPQPQFQFLRKWYMHVENTLKPSARLLGSWINANMVSRCLSRGMEYKSARLILAPCKAPGRPHLEYGVQLWSPYYGKDIRWIGNRQGGATKKMTQHFGTGGGEREASRASASVWGCLVLQMHFKPGC